MRMKYSSLAILALLAVSHAAVAAEYECTTKGYVNVNRDGASKVNEAQKFTVDDRGSTIVVNAWNRVTRSYDETTYSVSVSQLDKDERYGASNGEIMVTEIGFNTATMEFAEILGGSASASVILAKCVGK